MSLDEIIENSRKIRILAIQILQLSLIFFVRIEQFQNENRDQFANFEDFGDQFTIF
jgi:hypothetical protein